MKTPGRNYQLVEYEPYRQIRTITLTLPDLEMKTLGGLTFPVESSYVEVSLLLDGTPLVCEVSCEQDAE